MKKKLKTCQLQDNMMEISNKLEKM